jgi:hypothetical protein
MMMALATAPARVELEALAAPYQERAPAAATASARRWVLAPALGPGTAEAAPHLVLALAEEAARHLALATAKEPEAARAPARSQVRAERRVTASA